MSGIKVLVIGYGSIGKRHARILKEMKEVESVEVVTKQKTEDYPSHPSLSQLPNPKQIDLFVICVETHLHYEVLLDVCRLAEGRTILVEKPLFASHREAPASSSRIFVAYNMRFHPVLREMKKQLSCRKVLSARVHVGSSLKTWRPGRDYRMIYSSSQGRGGGVLLDLSHEIDYCRWLLGPFEETRGVAAKLSSLEMDAEDSAMLMGRTRSGTMVQIALDCYSAKVHRGVVLHAEGMDLEADLVNNVLTITDEDGKTRKKEFGNLSRDVSYAAMHRGILSGRAGDVCTVEEALETLKIVDDIKANPLCGFALPLSELPE